MNDVMQKLMLSPEEVQTLSSTIHEFKFGEPSEFSLELAGSPFLASVANKLYDMMIDHEMSIGRPTAAKRLDESRLVTVRDREVSALHKYIEFPVIKSTWATFSIAEKEELLTTLISPYVVSQQWLDSKIAEVDVQIARESI